MAGVLGPRVGGAHVDVNLKFDDKSLDQVGKDIHRQLSKLNKDLAKVGEQNQKVYRGIGQGAVTAWRSFLGSVITGAPLIGGAISGIAGAATLLGDAFYRVAQSSAAVLPMFTSLGIAGLTLSIGMRNFGAAVSEVDPKKLELLLKGMPKSMQKAVLSTRKFANEMRAAVWPRLFAGLSDGIDRLRNTGVLQRGLGLMADSLNGLAKSVLNYANSKEGVSTLNKFFANNAKVFAALSRIAVPFLDGFLRLINALSPSAIRLAGYIEKVALSFQKWTKGEGFGKRVDKAMQGAQKTAGFLWRILGNLGSAIMNIFNAVNPSTNTFLQILEDVTQRFQDWTASAGGKNTIAEWAGNAVDVMKQVGKTIEAIWPVIVKLADPRIFTNFLATLEGAFKILNKLPLEKMVNAFIKISDAMQPVSSFFLAIIIAGAAFNIMIGSLIGQVGGLFSVIGKLVKFKIITKILKDLGGGAGEATKKVGLFRRIWDFIIRVFGKVKRVIEPVLKLFGKTGAQTVEAASGASRFAGAFKPVLSILARFAKFAGWVGIAVYIGVIIAKSKDLQKKLGDLWDAFKGVFSQLGKSFAEIGDALKPLAPAAKGAGKAFGFIMKIMDKLTELALGVLLDMLIYGFKSLGKVIEGAGHIIAGLINVLVGLFTLDFGKVWEGLKQMASGIKPLLEGLFGLFITFFAPAKLAKLGMFAIKGLGAGIARAMPAILRFAGRFIVAILKFFGTLPFKLLKLGGEALVWLGRAMIRYAPTVLMAAARLVGRIVVWFARLPGRLLTLGGQAIVKLGTAIIRNTPRVIAAAGRIVQGIGRWLGRLPGRLFTLGGQAINRLGAAIRNGIGALKGVAATVVESVVNIIGRLPKKLLGLGGALLAAGATLGGKILQGIGNGLRAVGNMAGSIASTLKNGINNAIGLPKSLSINVLGKKVGFTIPGFERGGLTPGGLVAVGEGGPELVSLPRNSRVHSNRDSKKMMGNALPKRVVLRIGDRDFIAYVEELADGRINAADNLAWQGA